MLFNSISFLIFYPIVTLLFYVLPHRFRWLMLLIASCVFYMFYIPVYILILILTIVIDYIAGIYIEETNSVLKKKQFLILSIVSTCLILFFYKYFGFFQDNMILLANALDLRYPAPVINLILPIGLSFHTFQSLSYVIEVYRGEQKAERHFGIYSLYVMYYPQLVAGPIERPQNVLHQFHEKKTFNAGQFGSGLTLVLYGLFKKVVIADRLSVYVNHVYQNPASFTTPQIALATVFFAFQIYCDFSGYSDMARGISRTMGYELMLNFNRPYFSKSVSEFWRRWHISLSTWFKDYLYIPMGGNKNGKVRNLLTTFTASGLWHGANWTYIIWGALNGVYLVLGGKPAKTKTETGPSIGGYIRKALNVAVTFVLICLTWVFFRAINLKDALIVYKKIIFPDFSSYSLRVIGSKYDLILCFLFPAVLLCFEFISRKTDPENFILSLSGFKKITCIYFLIFSIFLFGQFSSSEFIYFQF